MAPHWLLVPYLEGYSRITSHGVGVFTLSKYFFYATNPHCTNTFSSLPISAFSIAVIAFVLQLPKKANPKNLSIKQRISDLDVVGASILIPAIILALQWGGSTYPWNNSRIFGLFVGSVCLILLFVHSQIKLGERATLPVVFCLSAPSSRRPCFLVYLAAHSSCSYFTSRSTSRASKASPRRNPASPFSHSSCPTLSPSIVTGGLITTIG